MSKRQLKILESVGALVVLVGLFVAGAGWVFQNSPDLSTQTDFVANVLTWGGGELVLVGVIGSIGARTVRSWGE